MFLFARAILRWLRLVDGPKIGLDVTRRYTVHHLENGVRKPLLASFGRRPQVGLDVTRRYTVHHLENGVCKPVGFVWSAARLVHDVPRRYIVMPVESAARQTLTRDQ